MAGRSRARSPRLHTMSFEQISENDVYRIEQHLESLLRHAGAGLSEYEVLRRLRDDGVAPFTGLEFHDSYLLFQAHFVLFHSLYRLRARLLQEGGGELNISPLCLCIDEAEAAEAGLTEHDALAEFYLDINNLHRTQADEVLQMLGRFWSGMGDYGRRSEAYSILGLEEGSKPALIRKRYRELAMEHHPDRGGDAERLKEINQAADILLGRNRTSR